MDAPTLAEAHFTCRLALANQHDEVELRRRADILRTHIECAGWSPAADMWFSAFFLAIGMTGALMVLVGFIMGMVTGSFTPALVGLGACVLVNVTEQLRRVRYYFTDESKHRLSLQDHEAALVIRRVRKHFNV